MTQARLTMCGLLLAAVAFGAGCGSSDDSSSTVAAADSGTTAQTSTASGTTDLSGQKMVFTNYGGEDLQAAENGWLKPFAKQTGVSYAMDSPTDPAKIKAMVSAGRTTWDIVDVDPGTGGAYCGKLFEKRPPDTDMSGVDKRYVSDECGIPVKLQVLALVYNTDKFKDDPPTKITDFMDTAKYPGKRLTFNYGTGGLESMELVAGQDPAKTYPIDYDKVGKAMDQLGDDLEVVDSLAKMNQDVLSGDFAMCLCYTGRTALAAQKGAPAKVVWDHPWFAWDVLYAVKGSKVPEAQKAFMKFIATPEGQVGYTTYLPYAPTTPAAKPKVDPQFAEFLPAGHEDEFHGVSTLDATWWAQNQDKAFSKWTEFTAG